MQEDNMLEVSQRRDTVEGEASLLVDAEGIRQNSIISGLS